MKLKLCLLQQTIKNHKLDTTAFKKNMKKEPMYIAFLEQ